MTRAPRRGLALVIVLVLLVTAACGSGDQLRDYVAQTYDVVARNGDTLEARSSQPVETVTADIVERFDPQDRYDDPAGTFMRYADTFVAVRPDPGGGTLISVDDDETGSSRYVPIIGGVFLLGGRYGGPRTRNGGVGESNRGGGPGSGK